MRRSQYVRHGANVFEANDFKSDVRLLRLDFRGQMYSSRKEVENKEDSKMYR